MDQVWRIPITSLESSNDSLIQELDPSLFIHLVLLTLKMSHTGVFLNGAELSFEIFRN